MENTAMQEIAKIRSVLHRNGYAQVILRDISVIYKDQIGKLNKIVIQINTVILAIVQIKSVTHIRGNAHQRVPNISVIPKVQNGL
jgi:hypothetical protein